MSLVVCKHCSASLEPVIPSNDVLVCAYCGTVHYVGEAYVPFPEQAIQQKRQRQKPSKFTLIDHPDSLEIRYGWLGRRHLLMLTFALIWLVLLIFISMIMTAGDGQDDNVLILLVPFYLALLPMLYYVLLGIVNQTSVIVKTQGVTIRHMPLPTFGAQSQQIARQDIAQVYCIQRRLDPSDDELSFAYDLHYVDPDEQTHCLLVDLDDINKAIYIEQRIEGRYHISDIVITGEFHAETPT